MKQVYIIFEVDTPQSVIDQWVSDWKVNAYWTGIPPYLKEIAAEEEWTLPHIIEEVLEE